MENNRENKQNQETERVPVMYKFKVLQYNEKVMTNLGIYSHSTTNFFHSLSALCILSFLLIAIILSSVFAYKNALYTKHTLESLVLLVTSFQAFGAYLNIGLKMAKIRELHLKLQAIADEGLFKHRNRIDIGKSIKIFFLIFLVVFLCY